jgi:leader peptidase (prepilin peptidase)/N-methyltransferase
MLAELPYWFSASIAVALGLTFGSFLNVVIHRLPRGENVAYPASRCPGCGAPIHGYDNIPVISWLILRGRARCCGVKISARYPLVELIGGLLGWAVLRKVLAEAEPGDAAWVSPALFGAYLALGLGLLAAIFIDLEFMLLPDEITLGGAVLGVVTAPIRHLPWSLSLLGAAIGFAVVFVPFDLVYRWIRGHPGMGLGDAKLVMLAGAWFGWQGALFTLLAAAIQGTLVALAVFVAKGRIDEPPAVVTERQEMLAALETLEGDARRELEEELAKDPLATAPGQGLGKARLAFGPFLALSTIEFLFFGDALLEAYLAFVWNG